MAESSSAPQEQVRVGSFGPPTPMRRGSLTERYQKCGKQACPCHHDVDSRHGPYFSLTRVIGGRTRTVHLGIEEAEIVRRQVEAARVFRRKLEVYWQECERCAEEETAALRATSTEVAEKGGSRRRSKRGLKRRSRSS
jgi:hypothetical protein